MRFDLKNLEKTTAAAVCEFQKLFGFEIGEGGIVINVHKSDENSCCLKGEEFVIKYRTKNYIFRAIRILVQKAGSEFSVTEKCAFDKFGIMLDCSRNAVYNLETLKKFIRILAGAGYNTLQLYTEDTYEVNNEPFFGYLRGRYSKEELKEIDTYASAFGIELIPCIQTLAHLQSLLRWPVYTPVKDLEDILLVGDERTYALIENIFATLAETFTSRNINIGMDEAHMVGLGKYLDLHGYTNRFEIMTTHLEKVNAIAKKYGFTCSMWSDMFFRLASGGEYYCPDFNIPPEIFDKLNPDINLIYWDYYFTDTEHYDAMTARHKEFKNKIIFAGGVWTWTGFIPNNKFSIKIFDAALEACKKHMIKEAFLTMWGDDGGECSPFSALPALIENAERAYGHADKANLSAGFKALTGCDHAAFSSIELPNIIKGAKNVDNPSKYMLYNDLFLGMLDSVIEEGAYTEFAEIAARLKKVERNSEWGYLFKQARLLCDILAIKYDLGIKTRRLYRAKDREGLKELAAQKYNPLIKKLEEFYQSFCDSWYLEKKPHGFDVQDIRLGGLIKRIGHCKERIIAYASGKTDIIEELDEDILDFHGCGKELLSYNNFKRNFTVNNF